MSTITVQVLNAIPYNSLNRNDSGAPKTYRLGGVERAQLSSQSLKRAARLAFEKNLLEIDGSTRSDELSRAVVARIQKICPELKSSETEWDKLLLKVNDALVTLSSKSGATETMSDKKTTKSADGIKRTADGRVALKNISLFLSNEEIEIVAQAFVTKELEKNEQGSKSKGFEASSLNKLVSKRTGSLSVAAFGRMFANSPELSTEAAVSVSDACSVHRSVLTADYFTTASDPVPGGRTTGAAFLSSSIHTSGVFHRSFSIDPAQLYRSWSGASREDAKELVSQLVRELVFGLPKGKSNSTAPYTAPLVVLAEHQQRRQAYQFETPVEPHETGGYSQNAVSALAKQASQLQGFDPDMISQSLVAGVADGLEQFPSEQMNLKQLIDQVADLVMEGMLKEQKSLELAGDDFDTAKVTV